MKKAFLQNFFSQQQIQSMPYSDDYTYAVSNVVFQRADYLVHDGQRLIPGTPEAAQPSDTECLAALLLQGDFLYLQGSRTRKYPAIGRISKMWTEHSK